MWGALSDDRTGLSFTTAADPRQHSPRVSVPRDSWPYFTVPDSWLHQLGVSCPHIYIPQEQVDPVITPGVGFPLRRLLRLAGIRWRYWNPPPRKSNCSRWLVLLITSLHGPNRKRLLCYCCVLSLQWKHACLRSRYLAMTVACFEVAA
jgi:hypothetical protein